MFSLVLKYATKFSTAFWPKLSFVIVRLLQWHKLKVGISTEYLWHLIPLRRSVAIAMRSGIARVPTGRWILIFLAIYSWEKRNSAKVETEIMWPLSHFWERKGTDNLLDFPSRSVSQKWINVYCQAMVIESYLVWDRYTLIVSIDDYAKYAGPGVVWLYVAFVLFNC